jgi:hypothetical protein
MVESGSSLVLDLGGGDRALSEHSRAMALPDFCESFGWEPLAIYLIGPDLEDFEHVFKIFKAGYSRNSHNERSLGAGGQECERSVRPNCGSPRL